MNRREVLFLAGAIGAYPLIQSLSPVPALAQGVDVKAILHDPEVPEGGNPQGDVTIVAFLDYNCPFCKMSAPALDQVVKQDGKIRLVYKDWPILTDASVYGAQVALGAKYQGRYKMAHDALMRIPGRKIPKETMRDAVAAAGIDMNRLQSDLDANKDRITALLQRNLQQAESLGLRGTPVYLVGDYALTAKPDVDGFKQAVVKARSPKAAR